MNRPLIFLLAAAGGFAGCGGPKPAAEPAPVVTPSARTPAPAAGAPQTEAAQPSPEAVSLLGKPLYAPPMDPDVLARRGRELAQAQFALRTDPLNEQYIIWFGRRLAYLGRYRQAIAVFTEGLILHPQSYRLLRHRGHRYITVRRLDDAIADLSLAAAMIEGVPDEVEPDGLPNARNLARSTTHTNIYYHLGLASYLKGRFEPALDAYRKCLEFSTNDDMRCATSFWLYLTLRRLGLDEEAATVLAPISADMDIIENFAYHELLLLYKGELTVEEVRQGEHAPSPVGIAVDDATIGYGIGAWYLLNGRASEALDTFNAVVKGEAWPAFGHIAAEAELARGL
jgi:tetratricopeptide (TPR) repeat protein